MSKIPKSFQEDAGVPRTPTPAPEDLVAEILTHRIAKNTHKAYSAAWRVFVTWCETNAETSAPVSLDALRRYAAHRSSEVKFATIAIDCAAIRREHYERGLVSPTELFEFKEFMAGLRKKMGYAARPKAAAVADVTKKMADACDTTTLLGLRDRAMILVLFATGMRRSELAAMRWEDVEMQPLEVRFLIRKSKTDQAGRGRLVRMPSERGSLYCPMKALEAWSSAWKERSGVIFRSLSKRSYGGPLTSAYFCDVVKNAAKAAGFDESEFGGHSMRRGHVTQAARAGKTIEQIMAKTGHRDANTVVRYIEENKELDAGMLGDG